MSAPVVRSWDDLRERFTRIALKKGISYVATRIPSTTMTVYRVIQGKVRRPSYAVMAGIKRLVIEEEQRDE